MMFMRPDFNEILLRQPAQDAWLYFRQPKEIITAWRLDEILPALKTIQRRVEEQGYYAAGCVAYEAAPAFDSVLQVKQDEEGFFPLLWFGIYPAPENLKAIPDQDGDVPESGRWSPDLDQKIYKLAIQRIKEHIARGDTYQVNFTYRLRTTYNTPVWPLFRALNTFDPAPYAAYLETEDWAVCSASPELFFLLDGDTLTSKPMKGTAPRGLTQEDDQDLALWLYQSEKNRAENVMIVDMVRNDIGRVARTGSVSVPELFAIEKYPTVWQMTSTILGKTNAGLVEIFGNLFPAASITGAPKVRTMQIIAAMEASPRRIYCGAIGYYSPDRQAQFNVAIRTVLLDKHRRQAYYGVGGGIVWDSQPEEEWQESITKARILTERAQPFCLFETLRWTPAEGWFLQNYHLERLQRSAAYFDFPLDQESLRFELAQREGSYGETPRRVRLVLERNGKLRVEEQMLKDFPALTRVALAKTPVQSSNRFLYHKTTRREVYASALQECEGFEDVLLWNERHELTESCIANLVVELGGDWFTPALECGLLPGVYRAWLLEQGKVKERVIHRDEISDCSRLFLVNSVRGMWQVELSSYN